MAKQKNRSPAGWDPLAGWYDGWVGEKGSEHHRQLAIPAVLELLKPLPGEFILDIGAGQGVLAPYITDRGAHYTGVDISARLLAIARRRHGHQGRFVCGDARKLSAHHELHQGAFDGAVFLLSIQDMNPLEDVVRSAAWALCESGRLVILMTHPCFRIPRQSGWGYDPRRKQQYRRIDCYLTPLPVPMKPYSNAESGVSISFHRPLSAYVNALTGCGLLVDCLREITTFKEGRGKAERKANAEIPLFLALRAVKLPPA